MKKKQLQHFFAGITICPLLITFSVTVHAQLSIGLQGGYDKNYLYTNISNLDLTTYKPAGGFTVGIPVQYQVADWFALQTGVDFVRKSYSVERSSFFDGVYQTNTNSYIQVPVIAHFMFGGEKIKGFLNLGMYGGYWAMARVKGAIPNILNPVDSVTASDNFYDYNNAYNYNEKYSFDSKKDNRLEFGWLAGVGMSYQLNDNYSLFIEGRYYQSVTDQQKKYMINQVPRYNQTYGISVGCMFSFGSSNE
jgi:hypothetical protein